MALRVFTFNKTSARQKSMHQGFRIYFVRNSRLNAIEMGSQAAQLNLSNPGQMGQAAQLAVSMAFNPGAPWWVLIQGCNCLYLSPIHQINGFIFHYNYYLINTFSILDHISYKLRLRNSCLNELHIIFAITIFRIDWCTLIFLKIDRCNCAHCTHFN